VPQAIQATEEAERDEDGHKERDPDAAGQSPLGRVRVLGGEVVIDGLHDVRHETLDDNEIAAMEREYGRATREEQQTKNCPYEMDTPKHLIAMAASKKTAARGNVSSATAKNDERRCGVRVAQSERR
jgi:hypothetical protein